MRGLLFQKRLSSTTAAPPRKVHRIGVVGSGPAGFYTAYKLLKSCPVAVEVDLLEALPIPYGLVRFGVAPDHPEVKSVQHKFDEIASDPRFRFLGNVRVGGPVSIEELRKRYHGLVLAYGASRDRLLKIPGESELRGIYGARDFVGWYNGLPNQRKLEPDLEASDTAVIIGQGNVALDVARILLTPVDILAKTDITEYALERLSKSRVRRVHVVGRRGPVQVAFTAKEFREMFAIPGLRFQADQHQIQMELEASAKVLAGDRPRKRLMSLLASKSEVALPLHAQPTDPSWSLRFFLSPKAFVANPRQPSHVGGVEFEHTRLEGNRAIPTGDMETIPTGLVFRSIGYQTVPVPGVPFEESLNHVPHSQGRVVQSSANPSAVLPGLYVAGWLKRGPSGVIAATMYDAFQTAATICADMESGMYATEEKPTREQLVEWLTKVQPTRPVTFEDWKKVEAEEIRRGTERNKPREKITDLKEIYKLMGISTPSSSSSAAARDEKK